MTDMVIQAADLFTHHLPQNKPQRTTYGAQITPPRIAPFAPGNFDSRRSLTAPF